MIMQDTGHEAIPTTALLAPVEALHRGFQFPGQGDGGGALLAAYASAAAGHAAAGDNDQIQQREAFLLGPLGLMIRYKDGSELADLPTSYRLPNAPDWFIGIANLHGLLVPVFDLANYLGVERTRGAKPMLLVLGHGADAAGVVIDGLPLRVRIKAADRADGAPVPAALEGCVTDTYWAAQRTWLDLQVDALLAKLNDELAQGSQ
jgi:purine-binding chemotaxis protein CheW